MWPVKTGHYIISHRTASDLHRNPYLTCYGLCMSAAFSASHKDDIALARIHVVILENEELIDAILLKRSNLDDCADGADQAAVKHEVLLAADLQKRQAVCLAAGKVPRQRQ